MSSRAWLNVPIGIAAIASLLLTAAPAAAQVQGEKLHVQARIGELCTVTSASLDFGQLVDLEGANQDSDGAIEIDCGAVTTPITVALDGGLQPGGPSIRSLTGGNAPITYFIFKDPARSEVWNAGEQVAKTIQGAGSVPVYGRVPTQGNGHNPGVYTDAVTITLSF